MALKFVSAKKPSDYANRLMEIQEKLAKLKKRVTSLEKEAKQLTKFLIAYNGQKSFAYDGPDYQMVVRISTHSRMILDQEKVMKLLKTKTPYKESSWTSCKVDFNYED